MVVQVPKDEACEVAAHLGEEVDEEELVEEVEEEEKVEEEEEEEEVQLTLAK